MRILDYIKPKELSRIARLQMLARGVVEGYCNGRHRSPHKGFSVEFKEHRPYVRGDDLKKIDWKAYGKSDRLYIREFEEETNLRCTLLVDRSGSMAYGGSRGGGMKAGGMKAGGTKSGGSETGGKTKHDFAVQLAASLTYLMLGQQDGAGLITFDDAPREIVPVRSRPSHLRAVLKPLTDEVSRRETDLGGVFRKIASKLKRRGMLIIISDGMGDVDSISKSLALFRSKNHEVIFFQILDPDEMDFPFSGRIQFRDIENPANEHTVDARSLQEAYLQRLAEHQSALVEACRQNRVDHVPLTTDRPFADGLHEYMSFRRRVS
ncbi:DUF58 domain-containing protein [Planctomycetes bacterium K23_9]|uniref:VWFA domain-containing protein n=1 Tax=Stieleria marina TaxID=1930275 RepID=A0A517NTP7_9BACT|nr:hypothetical protein K239x_24460 [Planctomycetes bacterium K23_9]